MSAGNSQGEIEVVVNAANTEETRDELESVGEQLEETGDEMADTAEEMGGLQERMQGLGRTLVAGLAVASAGLLSQIPVLGEAFSGLASVAQAVAFQMDQVLRPVLTPIANGLFQVSEAIFTAEGAWGTLAGVLGTVIAVVTSVLGTFLALGGSLSTVIGFVTSLAGSISGIVMPVLTALAGAISAPAVAIGALVAGIILLVEHFIGWGEVLDMAIAGLRGLASWLADLPGKVSDAAVGLADFVSEIPGKAADIATGLAEGALDFTVDLAGKLADAVNAAVDWIANDAPGLLADIATGLVDGILDFTIDLVGIIEDGVQSALDWVSGGVDMITSLGTAVGNAFIDAINTAIPNEFSITLPTINIPHGPTIGGDTITADLPDNPVPRLQTGGFIEDEGLAFLHAGETVQPAEVDRGDPRRDMQGVRRRADERLAVFIGGRQADQGVARYRDDNTLRRGRPQ